MTLTPVTDSISIHTRHIPPSTNACYRNVVGKGRARTKRYKDWAAAAGWDMNGHGQVDGPFTAIIVIDRKARHGLSDIDNRIKPVLDLLQTHGVIVNDRACESVTAQWGEADGGMSIRISPFLANVVTA